MLTLHLGTSDGVPVLTLRGPLVEQTSAVLSEWADRQLPDVGLCLVLDLTDVPEVDAAGLGALLRLRHRMPVGGWVVLSGARPAVAQQVRRAGLATVLLLEQEAHSAA